MSSKNTSKSKTGFFDVRAKPSGNFRLVFSDVGRLFWLGTYPTFHEAVRAYEVVVWLAGRPRMDLNFLEIETRADAELLVPGGIRMEEIMTKKTKKMKKRPTIVVSLGNSDEAVMARFMWEHPKYVQAEQEYLWKRNVEQKKKEDEAGPSTAIPIVSYSSDWGESMEVDEGCDYPSKDEFWEQFKSSDEE
nr:uncharacterized protein LOC109775884 [Aegilops tauschii subsp. strangulata]